MARDMVDDPREREGRPTLESVPIPTITQEDKDQRDLERQREEARISHRARFHMPAVDRDRLKSAAGKALEKLLTHIESPEFEKESLETKIKAVEVLSNRAYGRVETASQMALTDAKLDEMEANRPGSGSADHRKVLDDMQERHEKFLAENPNAKGLFPEMMHARRAERAKKAENAVVVDVTPKKTGTNG